MNFVAREEVIEDIREATCHTLIIVESNDISSTKMLILYIKYCTADNCRLMTKTVFAGIMPLARCDSHSRILEEIKKFYTTNNIDIKKMVMFTCDGAAAMLGKRNGVAKLLKNFVPHIIKQHCVAHGRRPGNRRCVVKSIPYARHWNISKNRLYYIWQIFS